MSVGKPWSRGGPKMGTCGDRIFELSMYSADVRADLCYGSLIG